MALSEYSEQIPFFLQEVLSKPASALPKGAQWVLVFEKLASVKRAIKKTTQLEPKKWDLERGLNAVIIDKYQTQKGCMFAQAVSIPEESVIANPEGLQYNHLLRTSVGGGRNTNNSLRISFLDTNISFVEHVIRPWVVTTGRLGMLARNPANEEETYRQNISIYKLGVTAHNVKPTVLIKYTFYNACPIEVSSEEYNYIPSSSPTIRETVFNFLYYDAVIPQASKNSIIFTNTEPKLTNITKDIANIRP
jgi:hypothetical protein